jgi:hypothetical protein
LWETPILKPQEGMSGYWNEYCFRGTVCKYILQFPL